jgi:S-adenosylmethionine:tRNA ribosyltransferase-isomerase
VDNDTKKVGESMKTSDFNFDLPPGLIAQEPKINREEARLMVIDRSSGQIVHRQFSDIIEFLHPEDILVLNDTRVIPARLWFQRKDAPSQIEVLLIRPLTDKRWICYVSPGKKAQVGSELVHSSLSLKAKVHEILPQGERLIDFEWTENKHFLSVIEKLGKTPLPPYIHSDPDQWKDYYQTVYAKKDGSVAAPTAGLHFTQSLLQKIQAKGTAVSYLTLHIGPGTFKPVKVENLEDHCMDEEFYQLSPELATEINQRKKQGGRCIAVGTTVTRTLESLAKSGIVEASEGSTKLFIRPPYSYQIVDSLVTNFHLPGSTLIMLVSAFYTREKVLEAYQEAIKQAYRFYSFGDAMMLL